MASRRENNKQYKDESFYFEDIVAEEKEDDWAKYEGEFEMEQYLEDFRDAPPRRKPLHIFPFAVIAGGVLVIVVLLVILFMVSANRRNRQAQTWTPPLTHSAEEPEEGTDDGLEGTESVNGVEIADGTENESGVESGEIPDEMAQEPLPTGPVQEAMPLEEPVSGGNIAFEEVSDTVTAKDIANIRSTTSVEDVNNIVAQLENGQMLTRTGTSPDSGWSRVEYDGTMAYALTAFLTDDPSYAAILTTDDADRVTTSDGMTVLFADCDDQITADSYVNLRLEPSAAGGRDTVSAKISGGVTVHRTGISPDSGWSRVEYEGETLYVVTGYMTVVGE